jgi:hypothetical protein
VENIDIVTLSIVRAFIFTSAVLVFQGVMAGLGRKDGWQGG